MGNKFPGIKAREQAREHVGEQAREQVREHVGEQANINLLSNLIRK